MSRVTGYAATPGTGPGGETCGTCKNAVYHQPGKKRFYKCLLMQTTHGAGTDIRLVMAACLRWERSQHEII